MGPADQASENLGLRELLAGLLAPFNKLRKALDASSQGLIVFEKLRVVFLNEAAEEFLNLEDIDITGYPFDELDHQAPMGRAVLQCVQDCRDQGSPSYEDLYLGARLLRVKASPAKGGLVLCTIEQLLSHESPPPKTPQHNLPDQEHPLLTAVLLLTDVVSREVPKGGEASFLCHQILRMLSADGLVGKDVRTRYTGEVRLEFFQICRELVHLIRYSLPSGVEVEAEIPDGDSNCSFRGSGLRCLLIQMAMDSAQEISQQGFLKISARKAEDSVILELTCRAAKGSLAPVNEISLQEARDLCKSLGGQLINWTERNRRVRLVNLPIDLSANPERVRSNEKSTPKEGEGKTVLLIDDEESIRSVGKSALSRYGYKVLLARDGLEGLHLFHKKWKEIDLVLLDLVMPRLGGAVCFEQLKEINPRVKVVLMSGFTRNRRVNDLMAKGCLFFLRKPFELTDLVNTVREAYLHTR